MRANGSPVAGRAARSLALLAVLSTIAACGDGSGGQEGSAPTPTATAVDRTPAPAATETAPPGGSGPRESAADDAAGGPNESHAGESARSGDSANGGRRDGVADRDPTAERAVATAVGDMYRSFANGDVASVCAAMATRARQEIARGAPGGSPGTCEETLGAFMGVAQKSGIAERLARVTVRDVVVDGGTARATVSFGGPGGEVQLVRERRAWRFTGPPLGAGG